MLFRYGYTFIGLWYFFIRYRSFKLSYLHFLHSHWDYSQPQFSVPFPYVKNNEFLNLVWLEQQTWLLYWLDYSHDVISCGAARGGLFSLLLWTFYLEPAQTAFFCIIYTYTLFCSRVYSCCVFCSSVLCSNEYILAYLRSCPTVQIRRRLQKTQQQ